ncbi:rRNA adenine N(6)-methyltransferase family protein [Paenibacillus sonchi]|uniref:rRNA adenine N(6)-methyltransferase family protein n=1 Tax=Paenibacillus sonchi TaxID=373687 RepID=UPI001E40CF44|nr:rRNA adenine N(6)-methyltransferase family protein [Paenibacillus sonchi]
MGALGLFVLCLFHLLIQMNEVLFVMPKNDSRFRYGTANFPGRHLLINKSLIKEMVELAKVSRGDTVIDIGAGTGALTFPLAGQAGTVIAIENDPASVQKLTSKMKEKNNINIKPVDVLQFKLPKSPFCVVANMPFSITTPIFEKFLGDPSLRMQRAVFITEKGAAKRFTAVPVINPMILAWRMWYDIRLVRTVLPNNFSPPPGVASAVVTVFKKNNPMLPPHHRRQFTDLASHALHYPYVPFVEAIGEVFTPPQIAKLAKELKIERNQAICTLHEQQWGQLFLAMLRHVPSYRWPKARKRKGRR